MTTATQTRTRFANLGAAIKAAVEKHPADPHAAAAQIGVWLAEDTALYRASVAEILDRALLEMATSEIHAQRRALFRSPTSEDGLARLTAMAEARKSLLDFALITCNKLLRDATVDELLKEAREYKARAEGNARMAKWFELIAEHTRRKGKSVIGDALDATALRGLQLQAGVRK